MDSDAGSAAPTPADQPPARPPGPRPAAGAAGPNPYAWPFLAVLAAAAAGLVVVGFNHFRRGTVLFALAVCLAALLRSVLPDSKVGLLKVRARWVDVVTLAGLGAVLLALALAVPPPS